MSAKQDHIVGVNKMVGEGDSMSFEKYRNPDSRCLYPFEDNPLGYCWGWANFIDGKESFADFKDMKACMGCECFAETPVRNIELSEEIDV